VSLREHIPESELERTTRLAPIAVESHEAWLPSEHPLHRPRHGGRQLTALICATVFFTVPALAMAAGVRPPEFENHRLAAFPSPLDGWSFFGGLSDWATDHLPFRDAAIRTADGISRGVFGEPPPFDQAPRAPLQGPLAPAPPTVEQPGDLPEPPVAAGFPKVIEGKNGWLYFGYDVQGKCRPVYKLDEVIANLNRLRDAVERSGREFVLVVAPDKSTVVPEFLPDTYVGKSCAAAASTEFWQRATTELGAIDLRSGLQKITEAGGGPPYRRLDTHWDDRGALLMVRRLADTIEPGTTSTWKVEPERIEQFRADLPKMIGREGHADVQMYSLAPDGQRDRTRHPAGDLRNPLRMESSVTDGMVTRSVGILSDSFMLPATRYLPAAFSDVDVAFYLTLDSEQSPALDVITDNDVVVVEVVERNLASGAAEVTDPDVVDRIAAHLAAHPRR
jgi:alginate O-acetyltransferase complex protein AlgJ